MSILAVRFLHPISYGQVVCRISAAKAPAAAGKRTFLLCCTHNNNTPHNPTCLPTTWPRFATGKRFFLTSCSYLHARVVAILDTPYFCHLSLSLSSRRCCKQPGWGSGREGVKWTTPTRIPPSPSSSGDDPSSAVSPTMDNNGEDQGHVVAASSPRLHLREGAELNGVYLSPLETAGTLSSNFKLVRDGSAQENKERERGEQTDQIKIVDFSF